MKKVGIVGKGHVGSAMNNLFVDAVIYDEPKKIGSREEINSCDIAFICVPTPKALDGSCNTSIVENVLSWLNAKVIVIRSTVPVGFTERMVIKFNKKILFQPEYYGETVNHPFADIRNQNWITLGGDKDAAEAVVEAYQQVFTSNIRINIVDAKTAELAKYMENCFFATKVIFCNEFYDLAEKLGINYSELRETWLLDPRIGRSHTFVYRENRGYGGACLPKDMSAIIKQGDLYNVDFYLLKSVEIKNTLYKDLQN